MNVRAVSGVRAVARALGAVLVAFAVVAAAGCTAKADNPASRYHNGRLFIATGNTTGTYYVIGGGFADLISKYIPGYEARAEPTGASGDNIARLDSGDMDVAIVHADAAAEAAAGRGVYQGRPQKIVALARLYPNIAHVVVREGLKINKASDLRGKRFSTGTAGSGTDVVGGRLLEAAGLDPERDVTRVRLSLAETTKAMKNGTIDAFVFVSGPPVPGIVDLLGTGAGQYSFLNVSDLLEPLVAAYGDTYQQIVMPKTLYNTKADVATVAVRNMLIASKDIPDNLAHDLVKVYFDHQGELASVHPEAGNVQQGLARLTDPVPLHPGARRFYEQG